MRLLTTVFIFTSFALPLYGDTVTKLKSISAKIAFEFFVEKPNHLSVCQSLLWTFSEHDQSLVAVDPASGKIRHTFAMAAAGFKELPVDTAALACYKERLLMAVNNKSRGKIYEWAVKDETLVAVKQFGFPGTDRATDLSCSQTTCRILHATGIYESSDLTDWRPLKVPDSGDIKKVNARPDLDPFEDWQSELKLARRNLTKVLNGPQGTVLLLDPFRHQVLVKNGDWKKWGNYGAWESSLMAPKAWTLFRDHLVFIADAKLKAVSAFTHEGQYVGVVTVSANKPYTPDYPLGLAADGNKLFVSDFSANKIVALDIDKFSTATEASSDIPIRTNLFRRHEVLKDAPSLLCMNCHDGTVSNQLYKYITTHFHHPLECSQCHQPHHNSNFVKNLRKPERELCLSCHKDYAAPQTNHVWDNSKKRGGNCYDCHKSHTDNEKLLVENKTDLCVNCHRSVRMQHVSTKIITDIDVTKQSMTKDGMLTCQTCHQTHVNYRETHFIKPPAGVLVLCSSCHGDKSPVLFKEFHQRFGTKKATQR